MLMFRGNNPPKQKCRFEGLGPEERLALVERATVDDYAAAVDAIHHKVAPERSHEAHTDVVKLIDPKTGEVRSYAAQPLERTSIMAHALANAKKVVQKYRTEGGSIEAALQGCGNLAAFGVVLAHKYKDGNGRTARTAGSLYTKVMTALILNRWQT
jgi:hypothetical protein